MNDTQAVRRRMQRIETLIHEIQSNADPATRARLEEVIRLLLELHGGGLERMLELIWDAGAAGEAIIHDSFVNDDYVANMLLLHGLHPLDLETRVQGALEKVRPYLKTHGGNVELLAVDEGVVRLRLEGSCHGCPSSDLTLKLAIETRIYDDAPDVTRIEVEGVVEQPTSPLSNMIPLEVVASNPAVATESAVGWEQVNDLSSLAQGGVRTRELAGHPLLFCRIGETFYAYGDNCPACGQRMATSHLEATSLVCPNCGQRYDVMRAGRSVDHPSLHLDPFPLLSDHGQVRVALPVL